jgi:transcriptional regulator GlxA family with amidase domain
MTAQKPHSPAPRIAILALPETSSSVIYGMYDLFMSAGRDWGFILHGEPGPQLLDVKVVASQGDPFKAGNGVIIHPDLTVEACGPIDVLCVPELLLPPGEPLAGRFTAEIAWLLQGYRSGALIATSCSGALLLAEAGLLDGQDATTHWAYCDAMKRGYPKVRVHTQRSLVIAGEGQRLIMAGGGTSWLDLALYLIARLVGVDAAMQTARLNLIDWHKVGQQPFARLAQSRQVDDAIVARCQVWIAEHYAQASPVAGMVRLSGLAERSF